MSERGTWDVALEAKRAEAKREGVELNSDTVDTVVKKMLELGKKNQEERAKLENDLFILLYRLLRRESNRFFNGWRKLLESNGIKADDIFAEAALILHQKYPLWKPQDQRRAAGKSEAHFISFFILALSNALKNKYSRPLARKSRRGRVISLSEVSREDKLYRGQRLISDERATREIEDLEWRELLPRLKELVPEQLNPLDSLVVILKFGLGQELFKQWQNGLPQAISRWHNDKELGRYSRTLRAINGQELGAEEMPASKIGELLGISGTVVRQRLNRILPRLRAKLESKK